MVGTTMGYLSPSRYLVEERHAELSPLFSLHCLLSWLTLS